MQSSNQYNFSACSTTICSTAENNTAGCCSLCGVITLTLRVPRDRWERTRDLGYMNMHNPKCVCLPASLGNSFLKGGAFSTPSLLGWHLFWKSSWLVVRFGSCFLEQRYWKIHTQEIYTRRWASLLFFFPYRHIICHLANVDRCACE